MKQAYTNTIRGGGRNPLTIATGTKKASARGKAKQQVPKCAYGVACNRKGCAFRHPEAGAAYDSYYEDPRSKICLPFLAGLCTYGNKCMNRHPHEDEAEAVKAKYKQKLCSYGDSCQTEGCLYFHPYEALEGAIEEQGHDQSWNYPPCTGQITLATERLDLAGTTDTLTQQPSYEQWLALNCPAPPHIDASQLNNIWYRTSGMQRDPWDVYKLMYPQQVDHNAAPQTWEPLASASQLGELSAVSRRWEPTSISTISQPVDVDPKSFEEWKKKGCLYPSWFLSDIDPWYDDEGVRRSLEEVYEVLYGENAQARFEEQEALRYKQEISADPTPAELAGMGGIKLDASPSLIEQNSTSQSNSGGWAQIASKAPVHQANNNEADSSFNTSTKKSRTVIMPKECWLPSTDNANYFVTHPDPIARFTAINERHATHLANIVIPTTLQGSTPGGKVTLIDVHFQSAKSVITVLNRFLPPALEESEEVWIIAGLGTHVEVGHQKRGNFKTGGVLFNAVKKYLFDNEEKMGIEWRYGKDGVGAKHANGSFLVSKNLK
ncbi:hypothetical protein ACHAW6_013235 [Cyclotella cf. meneghiniana]